MTRVNRAEIPSSKCCVTDQPDPGPSDFAIKNHKSHKVAEVQHSESDSSQQLGCGSK